jgi:hypothetical protein
MLEENARLFALLNIALADAAIVCWDAKYLYNFWRPITAIQEADTDGNPLTEGDPGWTPLLPTPPFPENMLPATARSAEPPQRFWHTSSARTESLLRWVLTISLAFSAPTGRSPRPRWRAA